MLLAAISADAAIFGMIGVLIGAIITAAGQLAIEDKRRKRDEEKEFYLALTKYYGDLLAAYFAWKEAAVLKKNLESETDDTRKATLQKTLDETNSRYAEFHRGFNSATILLVRYGDHQTKHLVESIDKHWDEYADPNDDGAYYAKLEGLIDRLRETAFPKYEP